MAQNDVHWESKLVLLLVVPYTAASVVLQAHTWAGNAQEVALWVIGLSALLGLVAWKTHAATPAAALTGAVITASAMFSTQVYPYRPWETALAPILALLLLTSLATRVGRERKVRLGTAEKQYGRGAAQVAANLGLAALVFEPTISSWMEGVHPRSHLPQSLWFAVGLAALAEAAGDTLSSELGQVFGGRPRMITTLKFVRHGADGAITMAGTVAGVLAGGTVALAGTVAWRGGWQMLTISWAGGVFGMFFDSLLGATVEHPKGLNNDAVNFLSTGSAAGFAWSLIAFFPKL